MSSLENRGNGSWRLTISDGYAPDGKKIRFQRTIHVDPMHTSAVQRREAEKQAALLEADGRARALTGANRSPRAFLSVPVYGRAPRRADRAELAGYRPGEKHDPHSRFRRIRQGRGNRPHRPPEDEVKRPRYPSAARCDADRQRPSPRLACLSSAVREELAGA